MSKSIQWLLESYRLSRDLTPDYYDQLRWTVARYERWLTRTSTVDDLSDDQFNRWIVSMLDSGLSPRTVQGQRNNLLCLWRAAYQEGLAELPPRRVRKVKIPATLPKAWEQRQLIELLAEAEKLKGKFRFWDLEYRTLFRAFILVAYESGLRLVDLLLLERDAIGTDGTLIVIQHKTQWPVMCRLRPETVAAVEATFPPERQRVFGDIVKRRQVLALFGRIRDMAGLKGGTRTIRKSGATAVESQQAGAAAKFLGHKSPAMAIRHYVDPRLAKLQEGCQPPPLILPGEKEQGGAA